MTYISPALRRMVQERANSCCEYCRQHEDDTGLPFHVEHIVATKHSGQSIPENLCWSCPECNAYKGTDIASIDPPTGLLTWLFNPRTQIWEQHFYINTTTAELHPLTAEGRVTVFILRLNSTEQIEARQILLELGLYPCE